MNAPSNRPSAEGEKQEQPMKQHCEHHAECIKKIQAILDGEATESEKEHFRLNMDKCMPCIQSYHLEKCIKEALHNKVLRKPCPDDLLAVIKAKVNS